MTVLQSNVVLSGAQILPVTNKGDSAFLRANNSQGLKVTPQYVSVLAWVGSPNTCDNVHGNPL